MKPLATSPASPLQMPAMARGSRALFRERSGAARCAPRPAARSRRSAEAMLADIKGASRCRCSADEFLAPPGLGSQRAENSLEPRRGTHAAQHLALEFSELQRKSSGPDRLRRADALSDRQQRASAPPPRSTRSRTSRGGTRPGGVWSERKTPARSSISMSQRLSSPQQTRRASARVRRHRRSRGVVAAAPALAQEQRITG